MKKHIFLVSLLTIIFFMSARAQELNTVNTKNWNSIQKAGFYYGSGIEGSNTPVVDNNWWWGISSPSAGNKNEGNFTYYNAQIVMANSSDPVKMYVRSTNNLGEGTWAKVVHSKGNHTIDGTLTVKEIVVKTVTGADFVFNEDYNLTPLSEVESFVKTNKHLPEIPSEKQMIKDGVNVTDLQIKLLQKIEELTLYTIQQQKQLEEQGLMIRELQSTINNNPK
ncbi:hypothetical protein [Dysgonomonas sp. ZJ279]|uniref:hypothetical protein n=1 Tax=Dysgonomonas sp. ZJ279 TaxID=2709796 RepID=UPI0013EAA089|nr:hypothetical protein [Dysgonomonas sp. ZJ279]